MPENSNAPASATQELSMGARTLLWEIMNGSHEGAYRAQRTPAEAEAIAAGAVVSGAGEYGAGEYGVTFLWVGQRFVGHIGPRSIRPDRCTGHVWPSCSEGGGS